MTTETRPTTTISDRNLAAYLRAIGHEANYSPRQNGHIDFVFVISDFLLANIQAYNQNPPIPVLSFLSAQRELTDAIRDHRNRGGRI